VKQLNLQENRIAPEGARYLSEALKHNKVTYLFFFNDLQLIWFVDIDRIGPYFQSFWS